MATQSLAVASTDREPSAAVGSSAVMKMAERFRGVRAATMTFAARLSAEDMMVQSSPEASPVKWHLAHTSWFFETFVLSEFVEGYVAFDPDYRWLFNSYYKGVGDMPEKKLRASFSRPPLERVLAFRAHVDAAVERMLESGADDEALRRIVLGLEHEQQHLELAVTDIKHAFFTNPLQPAYREMGSGAGEGPGAEAPLFGAARQGPEGPLSLRGVVRQEPEGRETNDDVLDEALRGAVRQGPEGPFPLRGAVRQEPEGPLSLRGVSRRDKDRGLSATSAKSADSGRDDRGGGESADSGRDDRGGGDGAESGPDDRGGEGADSGRDDGGGGERAASGRDDRGSGESAASGRDDSGGGERADSGRDDRGRGREAKWVEFAGGVVEVGVTPREGAVDEFAFDNETPRHMVYVGAFELAARAVTCAEYLEFMEDNGYGRAELWLSEGWDRAQAEGWEAPLYWRRDAEAASGWSVFTLNGWRTLDALAETPVCHVSLFEADAFARWKGCRLPTEFEWEVAAGGLAVGGTLLDGEAFHPQPASEGKGLQQMFGDVWEWTGSAYLGYPGYKALPGALGEYNGKFMSSQMVLRGGSCATPASHIRATYRNFFQPGTRWQFSGIRLARSSG